MCTILSRPPRRKEYDCELRKSVHCRNKTWAYSSGSPRSVCSEFDDRSIRLNVSRIQRNPAVQKFKRMAFLFDPKLLRVQPFHYYVNYSTIANISEGLMNLKQDRQAMWMD
jgi:hypothetical protein